jgi:hypothetical protein
MPLLGRVAERLTLDDLVQRAKAGRGGVIVVHGVAGCGKTALEPGRCRTEGGGGRCHCERFSGLSGTLDDILANDLPDGPTSVQILPGDVAFSTSACGTWMRE